MVAGNDCIAFPDIYKELSDYYCNDFTD